MSQSTQPKLSKNLLKMKFMKKTKENTEKEILADDKKALFDYDISEKMRKAGSKYVMEPSFMSCENLRFGRMSFRGFNPEIEKLMQELRREEKSTPDNEDNTGITDEDFAQRYSALVCNIGKKFAKKRQRSQTTDEVKVIEVTKQKSPKAVEEKPKDSMKLLYPKRKRAAEFWKPEED